MRGKVDDYPMKKMQHIYKGTMLYFLVGVFSLVLKCY